MFPVLSLCKYSVHTGFFIFFAMTFAIWIIFSPLFNFFRQLKIVFIVVFFFSLSLITLLRQCNKCPTIHKFRRQIVFFNSHCLTYVSQPHGNYVFDVRIPNSSVFKCLTVQSIFHQFVKLLSNSCQFSVSELEFSSTYFLFHPKHQVFAFGIRQSVRIMVTFSIIP